MDDILETFFMNMAYRSELSTMLPVMKYDRYPHTIIRPLALVREREIVELADHLGLAALTRVCPYGEASKRTHFSQAIDLMARAGDFVRDNLFRALANPVPRYLPRPTSSCKPDTR
jgi:tRNA(Ile)-lysidine synthase TilS/MesJ